jgi:hypothetical protein
MAGRVLSFGLSLFVYMACSSFPVKFTRNRTSHFISNLMGRLGQFWDY